VHTKAHDSDDSCGLPGVEQSQALLSAGLGPVAVAVLPCNDKGSVAAEEATQLIDAAGRTEEGSAGRWVYVQYAACCHANVEDRAQSLPGNTNLPVCI
jgi:hypothetical protein